ncbi:hypothetical protein EDC04DRAFT_1253074 [Pisolithus marmoratus]|nr:hypothetical protein EDC04DRAFT_1253074 [Pisolithus marmoratus]
MSVLVVAKFPSIAAVFMALVASVFLLLLAHCIFSFMQLSSCPLANPGDQEKTSMVPLSLLPKLRATQRWNASTSLPFTFYLPEKVPQPENNIGELPRRSASLPVVSWQPRTLGPQFQPPPPALYENPVPLSMAKLIMSRHTFRKPNPNRPRRTSIPSPKRPMSSPQTPSRLYHSIV